MRSLNHFSLEPLNLLLLTLGLCGLSVLRTEPVNKGLQPINLTLRIFMSGKLLFFMRVALFQKRIVIAGPTEEPFAAYFKDTLNKLV